MEFFVQIFVGHMKIDTGEQQDRMKTEETASLSEEMHTYAVWCSHSAADIGEYAWRRGAALKQETLRIAYQVGEGKSTLYQEDVASAIIPNKWGFITTGRLFYSADI